MDLEYAIKTFRIFSLFRPKINDLRINPNSETILIDSNTKIVLRNYFVDSKKYFNDSQSIIKIEYILDLIDSMYGKSNKEITLSLENTVFNEN